MNKSTLFDLSTNTGEYGLPNPAVDFDINKYRYLRISDINDDGSLNNSDKKSVLGDNLEDYLLNDGDIVFARTGASTGRNFYYESKYGLMVYAGFLIKFSLDKTKINPKFVKYFLQTEEYKKAVENIQVGSTRGNMNAKNFGELIIRYPNRECQDKIVEIFTSIDEQIERNNAMVQKLPTFKTTTYCISHKKGELRYAC